MPDERELGRAAQGAADTGPGKALNDLGIGLFLLLLGVACAAGTLGLRWEALLVWPPWAALLVFALRRRRDSLPQRAWLQGTVRRIEDRSGVHECDLAAATEARLGSTTVMRGEPSFGVLTSRDALTGDRVRYVFRGEDGRPLKPDDVRALAEALDAGPQKPTAARLREIAAHGREPTSAERVDWSHRITR
ncbi:hypothetical protein [Actinomadura violacea]|uniref:Integral membrane protein n=1 Tax=Actinomadura violacea TaxID=2819934 RepID=A0ABS3S0I0_9ACTN|nr:hypothetical protein [Actinomadura violacea]MBO2462509.1 hypothetical protein [Actinomadura violacea]